MENFYFKDYESVMKEWNRLDKAINKDSSQGKTSKGVMYSDYIKKYSQKNGSRLYKKVDGKLVLWDTRTDEAFDPDIMKGYVNKERNMQLYGTETPNKDFKYVDKLKQYFELEEYYKGTGGNEILPFAKRDELNIFGQRKVTKEGLTQLQLDVEGKLESLSSDTAPLFEESSYFDKNIQIILNKSTENKVSLKDANVNNRTQLLTTYPTAVGHAKNSNLTRELAINPE